jgi:hypothetical protein
MQGVEYVFQQIVKEKNISNLFTNLLNSPEVLEEPDVIDSKYFIV